MSRGGSINVIVRAPAYAKVQTIFLDAIEDCVLVFTCFK